MTKLVLLQRLNSDRVGLNTMKELPRTKQKHLQKNSGTNNKSSKSVYERTRSNNVLNTRCNPRKRKNNNIYYNKINQFKCFFYNASYKYPYYLKYKIQVAIKRMYILKEGVQYSILILNM